MRRFRDDSRHLHAVTCLVGLQILLTGCSNSRHTSILTRQMQTHAIFDPDGAVFSRPITNRSTWPATASRKLTTEWVEYQESITDYQGRNGRSDDYYRRRFYSVRGGGSAR